MTATISSFATAIDEPTLHSAMTAIVDNLAATTDPLDAVDRAAVARQAVSLAGAYADLCSLLGLKPPAFVLAALD